MKKIWNDRRSAEIETDGKNEETDKQLKMVKKSRIYSTECPVAWKKNVHPFPHHLWGFNRVEIKWLSRDVPALALHLIVSLLPSLRNILNPESNIQHPTPSIQHPASSIQHPESRIQNPDTWTEIKRFYRCSNGINPS